MVVFSMFQNYIFCLEIFSTYMTIVLILCDYQCEQKVLDTVYSGKVPDSANNGSSQKSSCSSLIQCEVLERPASNSHSEEQRWLPTFELSSIKPISSHNKANKKRSKKKKNYYKF